MPDFDVRDGTTTNCTEYVDVDATLDCTQVLDFYGLTIAQFYEWNPAVGPDCAGLWPNHAYCVRTPDFVEPTTTTNAGVTATSEPATTSSPGAPGPTQTGTADTGTATRLPTTTAAVPTNTTSASMTTSSAPTTTSDNLIPSPTQPNNIVDGCNKFAQARLGQFCFSFAEANGINTAELYAWNALFNSDGSGCETQFWPNWWYCVGVSTHE
ncbi:hypothetical protein H2201_004152 [Coniosporium apollinis]|uniref:LysM domain-containing protein n=2 Tax=Coniosporium TaxID=2810619 RepID=A0ABQ9NUQ7_9PEZI|nr:hypothetical protein H2199_007206 [Cladosporium sp. JES 115]KAJ9665668.1 hypothetical protein H2201_004152 [Coniosporium apollinis]